MLWKLMLARYYEMRGMRRKAGGIRAARSRALNKKSLLLVTGTSKTATPSLSVLAEEPK